MGPGFGYPKSSLSHSGAQLLPHPVGVALRPLQRVSPGHEARSTMGEMGWG